MLPLVLMLFFFFLFLWFCVQPRRSRAKNNLYLPSLLQKNLQSLKRELCYSQTSSKTFYFSIWGRFDPKCVAFWRPRVFSLSEECNLVEHWTKESGGDIISCFQLKFDFFVVFYKFCKVSETINLNLFDLYCEIKPEV